MHFLQHVTYFLRLFCCHKKFVCAGRYLEMAFRLDKSEKDSEMLGFLSE